VTRRRASWLGVALALLAITGGPALRAEEVEKKFRLGFAIEGYNTSDQLHSPSPNVRTLFFPNGDFADSVFDPRNDSGAISDFGIQPQLGGVLSASYAFNRMWYMEASAGYRRGTVGNVEVQAEFDLTPIPTQQRFGFRIFNLDGGTITQIPLQVTGGIRFRPKAALNPYLCAGVGYTFNSYEPSDEINLLSLRLDESVGGFRAISGTASGGEQFEPAASFEDLKGIEVDAQNAPEWHFGGGIEYSFKPKWVVYADARYTVHSGEFRMTVNGSNELGISVPADQKRLDEADALGPFGTVQISNGGLIDGGSLEPLPGSPADTDCSLTPNACQLTGPPDGIPDPGNYYVHAGNVRYDGASLRIGVKFTF